MKSKMQNTTDAELLQQLIVQLEHAWNASRDDSLVDRLAAEHPMLAEDLYEFFADLVEAELEQDRPRPELAAADERVRQWLEREGYRRAEAARRGATTEQMPSPTPVDTRLSSTAVPSLAHRTARAGGGDVAAPRPFLGLLREATGQSTSILASALDVTRDFLVDISDNADVLPEAVRSEFADRADRTCGVDRRQSLAALSTSDRQFERAASRKGSYQNQAVTYADLVHRSGLDPERKRYWLGLA